LNFCLPAHKISLLWSSRDHIFLALSLHIILSCNIQSTKFSTMNIHRIIEVLTATQDTELFHLLYESPVSLDKKLAGIQSWSAHGVKRNIPVLVSHSAHGQSLYWLSYSRHEAVIVCKHIFYLMLSNWKGSKHEFLTFLS
jgi:hypothetical protein